METEEVIDRTLLYHDVYLRGNPFEPAIADARPASDIVIEGTHYFRYVSQLKSAIKAMNKSTKSVVVIAGNIGSGKTAIIKRSLYDLGYDIKSEASHGKLMVNNKGILVTYLRVPIDSTITSIVKVVAQLNKGTAGNFKELAELVKKRVSDEAAIGYILILDQLERLRNPGEALNKLVPELRELYNMLGEEVGFMLILSTLRGVKGLSDAIDLFKKYIGTVHLINIRGLTQDEAKMMVRELLEHYRVPGIRVENPYYPFTEEGLDAILQELYRTSERHDPRVIYEHLGRALSIAVSHGLVPLTRDRALMVLSRMGLLMIEWLNALNIPYTNLKDALESCLRIARFLGSIEIGGKRVSIEALITDARQMQSLFELKDENKRETFIKDLRRAVTYLLVLRDISEQRPYIYFIKASVRPDKRLIESAKRAFELTKSVIYKGGAIVWQQVVYKVVCMVIPKSVLNGLDLLGMKFNFRVEPPFVMSTDDPQTYGAMMYVWSMYQRYKRDVGVLRNDQYVSQSVTAFLDKMFKDAVFVSQSIE